MNPFAEAARQAALQSQTADVVSLNNLFGVMHALKIISAMLLIFAIAYLLSSKMRRVVNAIVCAPAKMVSKMLDLIMTRLTPALITKWMTFSPERVQAMLKKACADHANPLIRGDIEQAREDQFPHEKYAFAWEYAPADVRRSVIWDGRLPDGSAVTNLAYRKLNTQIVADYAQNATRRAYRISLVMALGLTAVSVLFAAFQDWQQAALDFQVMAGSGAVKHTAYVADMTVNGTMQLITSALFAAVAAAAAFPALAYFGFWHQMKRWMRAASATLALPTRDTLVGWLQNADARASEQQAYLRHIQMAKKTTAIEIGKARRGNGISGRRGSDSTTPSAPQRWHGRGAATRANPLAQLWCSTGGSTGGGYRGFCYRTRDIFCPCQRSDLRLGQAAGTAKPTPFSVDGLDYRVSETGAISAGSGVCLLHHSAAPH